MTGRWYVAVVTLAAGALLMATMVGARQLFANAEPKAVTALIAAMPPFAAIAWFTVHFEAGQNAATCRRATLIVLGAAAAMRLILLLCPPDSTDIYRYVWDGRVQAAGINPYRYVPVDPALAALRDGAIYPNINRAGYAPTIYPPAAQIVFAGVGLVRGGVTLMKLVIVGFEALGIWSLLRLLVARGLPSTRILLYAWHPLPLFEFAGSGHVDAIAIGLMLVACLAADRGRSAKAGALLGAAIVAKFFPLVIAPALYRRWDWRAPITALFVGTALYLPYLSVGWRVFGFLGGYAHEEALDDGTGFFLLGFLNRQMDLPAWAATAYVATGLAILATCAVGVVWRRERARTALGGALLLLAALTFIATPHLSWYFTWAVPFLCFAPSVSVVYLTCAAGLLYWQAHSPDNPIYSVVIYLPFLLIAEAEIAVRLTRHFLEHRRHVRFANR